MTETDFDGTCTLAVHGELDLRTAPDLCARLQAHRGDRVLVDLTHLDFCDSCGLRALIGEARESRIAGGRMSVVAATEGPVRRLLEVTGLTEALGVHGDVEQALAAR